MGDSSEDSDTSCLFPPPPPPSPPPKSTEKLLKTWQLQLKDGKQVSTVHVWT